MSQAVLNQTLRELRKSLGKNSRQMGVSQVWALTLEHGRLMPKATAVRRISRALRVRQEVVYAACQESCRMAHIPKPTTKGAR